MSLTFMSDEWLSAFTERLAALDPYQGSSHAVQVEVKGGPDGKVIYHVLVSDGATLQYLAGKHDNPGVVISQDWDDALAQAQGTFDPAVAFMQGHLKVKGSTRPLLELFTVMARPAYVEAASELAANTAF